MCASPVTLWQRFTPTYAGLHCCGTAHSPTSAHTHTSTPPPAYRCIAQHHGAVRLPRSVCRRVHLKHRGAGLARLEHDELGGGLQQTRAALRDRHLRAHFHRGKFPLNCAPKGASFFKGSGATRACTSLRSCRRPPVGCDVRLAQGLDHAFCIAPAYLEFYSNFPKWAAVGINTAYLELGVKRGGAGHVDAHVECARQCLHRASAGRRAKRAHLLGFAGTA